MKKDLLIRPAVRTIPLAAIPYIIVMSVVLLMLRHYQAVNGLSYDAFDTLWRISVVIGAILVAYVYILYLTTTLRVGDDEMTMRSGIVTRHFARVEIEKITNYTYDRSPLELLFGLVDLVVESSGSTDMTPGIRMRFLCMADATAIMARIREEKEDIDEPRPGIVEKLQARY